MKDLNDTVLIRLIEPLQLEGLKSQSYLANFNTLALNWFLSNFKPKDDVTLVIYYPSEDAEEDVRQTIEELGYDIDKIPDILIFANPLSESKIPSLVAAVNNVIVESESSSFFIWANYLSKEIIKMNNYI